MNANEVKFYEDFNDIKIVAKFLLEKEGVPREEAISAFSRITNYDVALLKNIVNNTERK
jgi:hypothetical protein